MSFTGLTNKLFIGVISSHFELGRAPSSRTACLFGGWNTRPLLEKIAASQQQAKLFPETRYDKKEVWKPPKRDFGG